MSFKQAVKKTKILSQNESIEDLRKTKFKPMKRIKTIKDKSICDEAVLFREDYLFMDGVYVGQLSKTPLLPHGYGIFLQKETGAIYEGWRKFGLRSGPGRQIEPSGLVYDGDWLNNLPNGFGKVLYPDKNTYEGFFVEAKRHGYGKLIFSHQIQVFYMILGKRDGILAISTRI